jgi:hypothetical protein
MDEHEDEEQKRQLELLKILKLLKVLVRLKENKRLLDEERTERRRQEQIQLEALQKWAGEVQITQEHAREEQAKKQKEAEEQKRQDKKHAVEIQEETLTMLKKIHALVLTPAQQARQAHSEERNERDDLVYAGHDLSLKAFCCDYAEKTVPPILPLPEWTLWWPGTWPLAYEDKPHRYLISQDRTRIKNRIKNSR